MKIIKSYHDIEFLPEGNDEYSCIDDYMINIVLFCGSVGENNELYKYF